MQIVIPMSGFGERFRVAGYEVPKPLIEVDGKPIIAHVVEMFPGEEDFTFIVNEDHLTEPRFRMREILEEIAPRGRIVAIKPHKLGPVNAVSQALEYLDLSAPVLVNYCDFTCYWDWQNFKKFVVETGCEGAIPAYRGFHPHSLGNTNYAYILEVDGRVLDIQEKEPFTENRMNEFASSGSYYFKTGELMKSAFEFQQTTGLHVNSEFYVSLAYKYLLENNCSVNVYPLEYFMQWGTPQDLAEYKSWSRAFKELAEQGGGSAKPAGTMIMPMAGLGQRFVNEGYVQTKPLIPVSGKPMVIQAVNALPETSRHVFVIRQDMAGFQEIVRTISDTFAGAQIEELAEVTDGQARTVAVGASAVAEEVGPIVIGACDNGVLYSHSDYEALLADASIDLIVWVARGHANSARAPHMFGWVDEHHGDVRGISVKQPLKNPEVDPIVIGTMTFRTLGALEKSLQSLFSREGKVNGEFYLDSCITDALALGLRVVIFEVSSYISWGTPNDLKTFEYWQGCFSKWASHPYTLETDSWISPEDLPILRAKYADPESQPILGD